MCSCTQQNNFLSGIIDQFDQPVNRLMGMNGPLAVVTGAITVVSGVVKKIKAKNTAKDQLNAFAGQNASNLMKGYDVLQQMKSSLYGKYSSNFPLNLGAETTGKNSGRQQAECLANGYKWIGYCETQWVKIRTFTATADRLRNAEIRVEQQALFAQSLENELNRVKKILEAEEAQKQPVSSSSTNNSFIPSAGVVTSGGGWLLPAGILLTAGVVAKKKGWI